MKYSYSWLKEISGAKIPAEKAAEILTMHSFEIEGVEKMGKSFPGVVVAEILEIRKHPNADKLQLVKIGVGAIHESPMEVVCGAPNIAVGQKVPLALVGTKLPNGIEIKEAEIRGVKSRGMLCAADELGLGNDHSGIIILDKNAKVGESVEKYLAVNNTVIEIKVLPDRAHDALSHVGLAREISALTGKKMPYDFDGLKLPHRAVGNNNYCSLRVQIKDKDLCPRYIGAVMTNIKIQPSPKWMKDRLEVSGMNAINNVVDATNYVMLELGQPLHAFDFFKISGEISNSKIQIPNQAQNPNDQKAEIIVRRAKKNEKIELLDGEIKELSDSDLLITNGQNPLALAGIKGGKNSGITENTKTIILEAASFNATNIRKTRTRLGVRTESSDRFEKDIDPNLAEKAMARVIEILEHTASGKLEGIVDVYPKPLKSWKIKLDLEYVNSLLGEIIPIASIKKILISLDFKVSGSGKNISVEVPTFRIDVKTQEDLIEEIGRIWGYEKIKPQPIIDAIVPPEKNSQVFFETEIKDILAGIGFSEVYNYSFYSKKDAEICGLENIKHLELSNPQNPDQQLVRAKIVPNLLKNVQTNLKYFKDLQIFEVGRLYFSKDTKLVEQRVLGLIKVLESDNSAKTFYAAKGAAENFLERLGVKNYAFSFPATPKEIMHHPTRIADIKIDGEITGVVCEINPIVLEQYKIKKRVAFCGFYLDILRKYISKERVYKSLPKFPIVTRDISFLDKNKLTVAEISEFIKKSGGNLVLSVELFDTFQKDNTTSHAFHIHLGADRTLEGKEVDEIMGKIISGLEKELKVEIRK